MKELRKYILLILVILLCGPAAFADQGSSDASMNYYGIGPGGYIPQEPISTYKSLCTAIFVQNGDAVGSGVIKNNHITGNIVRCVESIINYGADVMVNSMIIKFSYLIFYSVTLAIIFHAIRMMFGLATHHGLTMTVLLKIIVVLYFCSPMGFVELKLIRNTLIEFPKSVAASVMAVPSDTSDPMAWVKFAVDTTGIETFVPDEYCPKNADGSEDSTAICKYKSPLSDFYDKFDTIILQTFGVSKDDANSTKQNTNVFIGIAALLCGLLFAGNIGATIAIVIITYIASCLFAIAELVLYFVVITLAINFLIAITPLALCCMLFEPTARITNYWFKNLLVYSIQPIVMAVFIMFAMSILFSLVKQTEKEYARLKKKWENADGKSTVNTKIFNCSFGSNSGVSAGEGNQENVWGSVMSGANEQQTYNYRNISGNLLPQDYKEVDISNCGINAQVLKLDSDNVVMSDADKDKFGILSFQDIRYVIGCIIAQIFMMMMIISFIRQIPSMVNDIVGTGGASGKLIAIVGQPSEHILRTVNTIGSGLGEVARAGIGSAGIKKFSGGR